jgi:signal transduction histidine kinase
VALTEIPGKELLEVNSRSAEGQYPIGDLGLALSSQAMLRGLDVVHKIGLELQHRRSPGELAREVIQILENMLGYDNVAILLIDHSAHRLRPFALSEKAHSQDLGQAYERYVKSHELRLGLGVPGWVAQQGQSLLYGDILREPRLEELETEMRSMLCVPIPVEGVVVGTLGVESRLIDAFTPLDQQLLETVAGQIAIAIQNAHLFSRVRQQSADVMEDPQAHGLNGNGSGPAPTVPRSEEALAAHKKRRDVAEHAHKAPAELLADLRAQVEELDAFNHTVAHDLKNPLSILLGFADILAHDYAASEDEVLEQAIRVIIENGRRMENIIDELLLLAEVRTVEQIPLMPLNMPAVMNVTSRRLSNLIKEYQAEIVAPESWPQAMGHEAWVEEIWVNYLSNAVKYGGPSPRVEVGGQTIDNGMVRFWVRDFGPGIEQADQRRLFIPFTKLKQANTKGYGLGLSIVQRIAKRLGGTVGLESKPGEGSLFWFTLPASPAPLMQE